jgi:hypothetical protein
MFMRAGELRTPCHSRDERYLAAVATVTGGVVQLSVQGCELAATPGPSDLIADDCVRVCPGQT